MQTGLGPYRRVRDGELRSIFYLTQQTGKSAWFVPAWLSTARPPPGTDSHVVTDLLRNMLYVHALPSQEQQLRREISRRLKERNDIAIRAKLLSLTTQIREKPWAFPACLPERLCRQFYQELKKIVDTSEFAADFMSDPFSSSGASGASTALVNRAKSLSAGKFARGTAMGMFAIGLTNFFAGKSKDYYEFYTKRISDELALRGIPPSSL
ncbi:MULTISPECIES: hypothetical protein [unclassified Sphingomonas]|uniref:hypothetical protein n=1 Tax=unclassified Sphingomonas TaxID=196159 RepID=UPI000A8D50F6|nr:MULTISPECIES: hypothetical protein [unclassified Sphingomonas]